MVVARGRAVAGSKWGSSKVQQDCSRVATGQQQSCRGSEVIAMLKQGSSKMQQSWAG